MTEHADAKRGGGWIGAIIRFCLEQKLVVILLMLFITGFGVLFSPFDWTLPGLPDRDALPAWLQPVAVDAIPDIGENQQIVFTTWPGRSPQDVEGQVTYPLTVALLGVPEVKTIRSQSMFGFSTIYVIFKESAEFYWSRSRLLEKLNSLPAGTLPDGVQPALGPDATALGQVFWYTLEGRDPDGNPAGGWDLDELRSTQDWYVRYALLSADGVAEVASVGGFVREYQIDVDPDAMRAHGVTLEQVFHAVRMSNIDVGARTVEINRVEYVIRGLGFIKRLSDIEQAVVRVADNVPLTVKDVATVALGPGIRRGALDKSGAQAVGGVVVVRYGNNPLATIKSVKKKIEEIAAGLPAKTVIDWDNIAPDDVRAFGSAHGFEPFDSGGITVNEPAWIAWLSATSRDQWPAWVTTSQVTIVPFYDRSGLIYETLDTLNEALVLEILVTVIVVIVMVLHLRSSLLISSLLPLAVLMTFIAMKVFGVDANIVALSGIAIAIGTMVDMGIVLCENILKHLDEADANESRLEVIHRAATEVGSAVVTAVATTVVSFLPVFMMIGAEGKLFKPLAFTKTFALIASVIVALTIIPPVIHMIMGGRIGAMRLKQGLLALLTAAGVVVMFAGAWWVGLAIVVFAGYYLAVDYIPARLRKVGPWVVSAIVVVIVAIVLTQLWLPLGPQQGLIRNCVFVAVLIGGVLVLIRLFEQAYAPILRWCLAHKGLFLMAPALTLVLGAYVWLGPQLVFGPSNEAPREPIGDQQTVERMVVARLIEDHGKRLLWTGTALASTRSAMLAMLQQCGADDAEQALAAWDDARSRRNLRQRSWYGPNAIRDADPNTKIKWTVARDWAGRGKEFMPALEEGSFLYMPTTMPHASIGEAIDVLRKLDMAITGIPEVSQVVGKIGRAESALDPAPISMIETIINYHPEYVVGKDGRRMNFRFNEKTQRFDRDDDDQLIPDPDGRPFRTWRDDIRTSDDIWREIEKVTRIPGTTGAPKLQPIAARLVMLQSGMRAPMGVKIKGPNLETIEQVGFDIERLLKQVPSVEPSSVIADRIVGKPYLEIHINREEIARYGLNISQVQEVIEVAIGGKTLTHTVEGRERYPVRVRYPRELRGQIETLDRVLVAAPNGVQVPLSQVAEIKYVRGPQNIKSEDTFLVGYVLFDMKTGYAEVDVVDEAQAYLKQMQATGELALPAGVSYTFAGNYTNQLRSQKTLAIVLPLSLFVIFLILYLQFRSTLTTSLVFSGILVAWAGGFIFIWLYGQPWFLNFEVFGVNMRMLFKVHPINLSVAVWVGFLALYGIASDNGVIIATYLKQSFNQRRPVTIDQVRDATVAASVRRARPCLMTTATTLLALLPVLTSSGRGADIMVPMAIPSFGGMAIVLMTIFVVPVLYCLIEESKLRVRMLMSDPDSAER